MRDWIDRLLASPGLDGMGHAQRKSDANLGLGWVYYALARACRPTCAVVIGSYRGYVPILIARALSDNEEKGEVHFIDPSLVDDFWKDPARVREHFASLGVHNIRHHLLTTQQFVETETYRRLPPVGLLFIDGYHSAEQARFDHRAFIPRLAPDAFVLFHDSIRERFSRIYGPDKPYRQEVVRYIDELKRDPQFQVFDIPIADGVTLVRQIAPTEPMP